MNKLLNGNSIEIIKEIESNSIHCVISDIPYGIGISNWDVLHNNTNSAYLNKNNSNSSIFKTRNKPLNGWSKADRERSKEYEIWCDSWSSEIFRLLKNGSYCFIFCGRQYSHRCIVSLENNGFILKVILAWIKPIASFKAQHLSEVFNRRNDKENSIKYKDYRLGNLKPLFEPILWFQKPYKIGTTITDNMLINGVGAWNEKALEEYNIQDKNKLYSNIIQVDINKDDKNKYHITQKPLNLIKLLISLSTQENQIVLDPFMGFGTTCLASKLLNRQYIGIELDKNIYDISVKRLENVNIQ